MGNGLSLSANFGKDSKTSVEVVCKVVDYRKSRPEGTSTPLYLSIDSGSKRGIGNVLLAYLTLYELVFPIEIPSADIDSPSFVEEIADSELTINSLSVSTKTYTFLSIDTFFSYFS